MFGLVDWWIGVAVGGLGGGADVVGVGGTDRWSMRGPLVRSSGAVEGRTR